MLRRSNVQTAARLAVVLLGPLCAFAAVAAPATVSVGDAQVTVTNGMATTMRFTVTRSGEMGDSVVVQYRTRDDTAKAGTDYTATSGTLTIAPQSSSGTVSVPIAGQSAPRSDKRFSLQLQKATGSGSVAKFGSPFQPALGKQDFGDFVAGDFNGDGKLDLATAGGIPPVVAVLLNNTAPGAGTPSFAARQDFSAGTNLGAMAAGDLNGDGKLDLVVVNGGGNEDGALVVLLNQTPVGSTTLAFTAPQSFPVGALPTSVALADFDRNGALDLIAVNNFENTVSVRLNFTEEGDSMPFFTLEKKFPTADAPFDVAVGDINGDGKPDLVISNNEDNKISVLIDQTNPGANVANLAGPTNFRTSGAEMNGPLEVQLGDVNGDGRLDVVAASHGLALVSVLLNATPAGAAAPVLAKEQTFDLVDAPDQVGLGDLNGDGKLDIVVPQIGGLAVLRNKTPGGARREEFAAPRLAAPGDFTTRRVVIGDFNGDGRDDLVASSDLAVLLNRTPRSTTVPGFGPHRAFATNGGPPRRVAVGNIAGDGRPDLAVVANRTTNSVSVLRNITPAGAAAPVFASPRTFEVGAGAADVAIADINGDGRLDLAVSNFDEASVSFLINIAEDGATQPSFAAQQTVSTAVPGYALVLGDINADGKPDLLVTGSGGVVAVRLNKTFQQVGSSTVSFGDEHTFGIPSDNDQGLALGDLNGDGRPDLVISNPILSSVSLLANTTEPGATVPSFAKRQTFQTGGAVPQGGCIAIGDVNGDGRADLVVANSGTDNVSVLINTTAPGATRFSFGAKRTFPSTTPIGTALSDIDGDGKLDILVSNVSSSSNSVSLLLNRTEPGAAVPHFAAQRSFASGFGPIALATGDFNSDGKPDVAVANLSSAAPTVSVMLNNQYQVGVGDSLGAGTIRYVSAP